MCRGIGLVRVGGRVVYATCSLVDMENDGVVGRVVERGGGAVRVVTADDAVLPPVLDQLYKECGGDGLIERTRYGWMLLPDAAEQQGWGPLYCSVLEKVDETDMRRPPKENKYKAV